MSNVKNPAFNHNNVNLSGNSRIVRTIAEFARENGLKNCQIGAMASHMPLPKVEFAVMKNHVLTNHYTRSSLVKWLLEYRAKYEAHSS
jgi:hypothetical protein